MKLFFLLLLLFSKPIFAQGPNDKIMYLDSLDTEVSIENKFYTKIIKDYNLEKPDYKVLKFYKNGNLKEEATIADKDDYFITGEQINYYENGNKSSTVFYENKSINGKSTEWYENGKLKKEGIYYSDRLNSERYFEIINFWNNDGVQTVTNGTGSYEYTSESLHEKGNYKNGYKEGTWLGDALNTYRSFNETYEHGYLVSGESIEFDGTKNQYKTLFKKPQPQKGLGHFYKFIANNFNLNDAANKKRINGKIIVGFVVDKDGKIVETKIVRGLGYGLDEEAIRVLLLYENWEPAYQRGRRVRCSYNIPIAIRSE